MKTVRMPWAVDILNCGVDDFRSLVQGAEQRAWEELTKQHPDAKNPEFVRMEDDDGVRGFVSATIEGPKL